MRTARVFPTGAIEKWHIVGIYTSISHSTQTSIPSTALSIMSPKLFPEKTSVSCTPPCSQFYGNAKKPVDRQMTDMSAKCENENIESSTVSSTATPECSDPVSGRLSNLLASKNPDTRKGYRCSLPLRKRVMKKVRIRVGLQGMMKKEPTLNNQKNGGRRNEGPAESQEAEKVKCPAEKRSESIRPLIVTELGTDPNHNRIDTIVQNHPPFTAPSDAQDSNQEMRKKNSYVPESECQLSSNGNRESCGRSVGAAGKIKKPRKRVYATRKRWTDAEDSVVLEHVATHGLRKWEEIVPILRGRSAQRILERWNYKLNPAIKKSHWTKEEDEKILVGLKGGNRFSQIVSTLLGRPEIHVRNRYLSFLSKRLPRGVQGAKELQESQIEYMIKMIHEPKQSPGCVSESI